MWVSKQSGAPARLPSRAELCRSPLSVRTIDGFPVTGLPEELPELDGPLVRALWEAEIPGMVLTVARNGKPLLSRGYGTVTAQSNSPVEPTVPAMLCSLCKPLTAQAFLGLARAGKLTLDSPVTRWLPAPPALTLRHLLQHRGGLPARFPTEQNTESRGSERERVERALAEPLLTPPGDAFLYSNVGYQVLGRVLEAVTGKRPDQFLQEQLLTPLEIKSYFVASYLAPADQKRYDSGAAYVLTPNRYDTAKRTYMPVTDRAKSLTEEAWGSADVCGAGCMSAVDYLRFLCSLTPEHAAELRAGARDGYGLGWMVRDGGLAHTGTGSGETHYALRRDDGLSLVCFLNSSHDDACFRLLERVLRLAERVKPSDSLRGEMMYTLACHSS